MNNKNFAVVENGETLYTYRVVIYRDADDVFIAECPALKGCVTDGATFEEALGQIKDAVRVYVSSLIELGKPIPKEEDVFEGVVSISL